jgi:hypothetical protein
VIQAIWLETKDIDKFLNLVQLQDMKRRDSNHLENTELANILIKCRLAKWLVCLFAARQNTVLE